MTLYTLLNPFIGTDVYIDLGTANTLVMEKQRGLVANEPSVIAYQELEGHKRKIVAVGNAAKKKIGRTPGHLIASYPLKDGVVADLDATEAMLQYFLGFVKSNLLGTRPSLVVSLPYGVSDVERKAVVDCGLAAGAKKVQLIEEPMAAAIGSGLSVESTKPCMILDIGGGTTEAAVIALSSIVHCEAVRVGGHSFDRAIVDYIRKKYNLIIGEPSAEKIKIAIGTVLPGQNIKSAPVKGVDFVSGLPREVMISSDEVAEALEPDIRQIVRAGCLALEKIPPEVLSDLVDQGLVLAGGGALINGITERISRELKIPAQLAEDPLTAIAIGGQRVLHDKTMLSKIVLD